jgi:hypothetical protein
MRPEHCGNTHLDDMQDYVVKMGSHSVLLTSNCEPVIYVSMEGLYVTNTAHVTFSYKESFKIPTLALGYNGGMW